MASQVVAAQEVRFDFIHKDELPDDWTCSFCDSGQKEFPGKKITFVTNGSMTVHAVCAIAMKNLAAVFGPNRDWVGEIYMVPKIPDEGGNVVYHAITTQGLYKYNRKVCLLYLFSQDDEVKAVVNPHAPPSFSRGSAMIITNQTKDEIRAFLINNLS